MSLKSELCTGTTGPMDNTLLFQGMYNNGPGGQQQQQQMYAGARGYRGMPGQFQPGYNGFNNSGYNNQQQGASNMAAYPQQQQQFQAGYSQQHPGYPQQQQQQQWYPNGQGYDQSNWSQQQQHMGWNNGMGQWNGQQQPSTWANNMSPRTESSTPSMYNNTPQQMPAPAAAKDSAKRGSTAGASTKNVEMQPEAYQRTLAYVQQCQSWSSGPVMSPDSSQPSNGAKPKTRSPAQAAGAPGDQGPGAVMPPPMAGAMTPRPATEAGNMIIGDMSSSMNILTEENRFLHLMQ